MIPKSATRVKGKRLIFSTNKLDTFCIDSSSGDKPLHRTYPEYLKVIAVGIFSQCVNLCGRSNIGDRYLVNTEKCVGKTDISIY